MRNIFKFKIGDKEFVSNNHVEKAFDHWLDGEAFSAYMSVFYKDKRVDKKAEVVEFNDNIANGELFATYRISVSDAEMPYGITRVGFAPYPEAELSNECEISMPPAAAVIYGTVYLEPSGNMSLYPGENPLVRSLLGMTKCINMDMRASNDKLNNVVAMVDGDSYKPISYTVNVSYDGLEFDFGASSYSDFMLFVDSKPCVRFNASFAFPYLREKTANSNHSVNLADVIGVENVHSSGTPVDFGYFYNIDKIYPSGKKGIKGFNGYKLFCDPLHKYVGLKTDDMYRILDVETQKVTREGYYEGELTLCSDGSLVSINNGVINFIDRNTTITLPVGQTAVISRAGGYDIFLLLNNEIENNVRKDMVRIYRYETSLDLTNTLRYDPLDSKLGTINNFLVTVYTTASKRAYYWKGMAAYTYYLSQVYNEPIIQGIYYGDGYVGSIFRTSKHQCDRAFNNFFVKNDVLSFVGTSATVSLGKKENVEDAILVGDTVILRENGVLNFYKASIVGINLNTAVFGSLTWNEKVLMPSQINKLKLKIKNRGNS